MVDADTWVVLRAVLSHSSFWPDGGNRAKKARELLAGNGDPWIIPKLKTATKVALALAALRAVDEDTTLEGFTDEDYTEAKRLLEMS